MELVKKIPNDKFQLWILSWLLIAPLPAALTYAEIPHAYRTLFLLVPIAVIIAQGLVASVKYVNHICPKYKKGVAVISINLITVALGWNVGRAWHQYSHHQQIHQPWHRTSGYKELVEYINQLENKSDRQIVITRAYMEPYIFFLFYNQIEPENYQALEQKRLSRHGLDVEKKNDWEMFGLTLSREKCPHLNYQEVKQNSIFFSSLSCEIPYGYKRVKTINFADGVPTFNVDIPITEAELKEF